MSATYYLLLTDHGSHRLAAAQAGTQPFQITHLAIGDANNLPYLPQSRVSATQLLNERARVPVQSVIAVEEQVEVLSILDHNIGGFNLHEIGLLDESGQLLYIGNYHGAYKPTLSEGAGGDLELVCVLQTSNLAQVVVKINPSMTIAHRAWVTDHFVSIPTFNDHMTQNSLEHANLLQLIQALQQQLLIAEENNMTTATIQSLHAAISLVSERVTVLESKRERILPIGTVIETTKPQSFTAQDWAAEFGYNTIWAEDIASSGSVIVGAGTLTVVHSAATGEAARSNEERNFLAGERGGEFTHKMIRPELARISGTFNTISEFSPVGDFVEQTSNPAGVTETSANGVNDIYEVRNVGLSVGSSQPFNVMQPYLVRKKFVLTGYTSVDGQIVPTPSPTIPTPPAPTPPVSGIKTERVLRISEDTDFVNIMDMYISNYGTSVFPEVIRCIIEQGAFVTGRASPFPADPAPALISGLVPSGTEIIIDIYGTVAGLGGLGGGFLSAGRYVPFGAKGGTAYRSFNAPTVINIHESGKLIGGAGGGGAALNADGTIKCAGGGGAPFGLAGLESLGAETAAAMGTQLEGGVGASADGVTGGAGGSLGQAGANGSPANNAAYPDSSVFGGPVGAAVEGAFGTIVTVNNYGGTYISGLPRTVTDVPIYNDV